MGPQIELTAPLGYLDLTALASQARVIATDSGGLQKEAYWYSVPWCDHAPLHGVGWTRFELGANVLVDDDPAKISRAVAEARMPGRPTRALR